MFVIVFLLWASSGLLEPLLRSCPSLPVLIESALCNFVFVLNLFCSLALLCCDCQDSQINLETRTCSRQRLKGPRSATRLSNRTTGTQSVSIGVRRYSAKPVQYMLHDCRMGKNGATRSEYVTTMPCGRTTCFAMSIVVAPPIPE